MGNAAPRLESAGLEEEDHREDLIDLSDRIWRYAETALRAASLGAAVAIKERIAAGRLRGTIRYPRGAAAPAEALRAGAPCRVSHPV